MDLTTQLISILNRKKNLFLSLEAVTETMLALQVDDLALAVEKRGELLEEIEGIDAQVKVLCGENTQLLGVLNYDYPTDPAQSHLLPLYDLVITIKASVNRLLRNNELVKEHLVLEQAHILSKIQALNKSSSVIADRYYRSVQTAKTAPTGHKKGKLV